MNRRHFLSLAGAAGLAPLTLARTQAAETPVARDYYELRHYRVENQTQRDGLDAYLRDAEIPALNRLGVRPVGVFYPDKELSPVTVLVRHKSLDALINKTARLFADPEYVKQGAALLDAPASAPAFQRVESSLLVAFQGLPSLETPIRSPGRVFQLRIYESPSVRTNQKKIEMFNTGEIAIFRKVGLHPVFFGEAIIGTKVPNLTYLLVFESLEEQQANWKKFGADPDWQKLRAIPDYADKKILSGITNLPLVPAPYSQI